LLEAASRSVDDFCGRSFFVETATKYFDGPGAGQVLLVPDLLSVTTFKVDNDADGSWDDETWTSSDYMLYPRNVFPKQRIYEHPGGDYAFGTAKDGIEIAGLWGYGDGKSATPYAAAGVTVTVATTTGTTITVSADDTIKPGHTILAGTEQMYCSAVGTGSFTAERGVNGTTAATHSTAAASIYEYPANLVQACLEITARMFDERTHHGYEAERIGDYSYKRARNIAQDMVQILGLFRKGAI
jgi:hypothetical protein